ncbi:hypothetical protein CSC2_26340 [Clostridium zeae]|uniref:Uncharacterized protein n=1 Tax=Clostridium zeae TaxID=2759022 RepID=A0ABQ1EBB9_9CLOT|nr:hypothetical protein CSC2_26340 [Clostridium zeae]
MNNYILNMFKYSFLLHNKFGSYLNQKLITKRDKEKSFATENECRPNVGMYKLLD